MLHAHALSIGTPWRVSHLERTNVHSLIEMWTRYRHLLIELTKREFVDRYAHQAIGSLWAWLHPLFLMLLYTAIFNFVFAARLGNTIDLPRDFTAFVLTGLVPWLCIQDVLGRGSGAVLDHVSFVKQMAFPMEVLPIKRALSSLPILLTGMSFLVLYQIIVFGSLPWTVVFWPLFFLLLAMFAIGLVFLLGAVGLFLRDLREIVGVFCTANLFMMPIVFIPDMVPSALELIFYANPFSYMIWMHQDIMIYGRIEHPLAWIVFPTLSLCMVLIGTNVFQRLRPHFGDAI